MTPKPINPSSKMSTTINLSESCSENTTKMTFLNSRHLWWKKMLILQVTLNSKTKDIFLKDVLHYSLKYSLLDLDQAQIILSHNFIISEFKHKACRNPNL